MYMEYELFSATYLRHYDGSSEYAAARQQKVAEVACCRIERTLMGCADPPKEGGSAHPISVLELTRKRSGWEEFALTS